MDISRLIQHPEEMNKETLYDLRSLLALHPYYQTARLLMLQNLYLLHDSSFDEELRRAAIYITDRKKIFNLIEAAHYQLRTPDKNAKEKTTEEAENRTVALIDNFLDSLPQDSQPEKNSKRKPTPADATVDYVAYLLESESEEKKEKTAPQLIGHSLIDDFLNNNDGGRIVLPEEEYSNEEDNELPNTEENDDDELVGNDNSYFTETLARIYIKQGRYSKALEIIQRLNLINPKKNRYFADQIRFLEKLIINNNKK